jgi:hypothetical protein
MWDKLFASVLAGADGQGRIGWSMVSVVPLLAGLTSTLPEREEDLRDCQGKGARQGSTTTARASDAPGAD